MLSIFFPLLGFCAKADAHSIAVRNRRVSHYWSVILFMVFSSLGSPPQRCFSLAFLQAGRSGEQHENGAIWEG